MSRQISEKEEALVCDTMGTDVFSPREDPDPPNNVFSERSQEDVEEDGSSLESLMFMDEAEQARREEDLTVAEDAEALKE